MVIKRLLVKPQPKSITGLPKTKHVEILLIFLLTNETNLKNYKISKSHLS